MGKKIVVLAGSPRIGGNKGFVFGEKIRGAGESGNEGTKFYLAQKKIHPCIGCISCRQTENKCVFREQDDFEEIIQAVIAADVLVIASPVYFYGLTAQMKTAMDRFFAREAEVKNMTAYFVTTAAAPAEEYIETAKACFRGFISCFENVRESGIVAGLGTREKGEVKTSPAMQEAYDLGKRI